MSLDEHEMNLTRPGRVTIYPQPGPTGVQIILDGFDGENCSCRDLAVLAQIWAIGALQESLIADVMKPGGGRAAIGYEKADNKRPVVIELDQREHDALDLLCADQEMSRTNVMRQALRLYQMVRHHAARGEDLAFTKNGEIVRDDRPGLAPLE